VAQPAGFAGLAALPRARSTVDRVAEAVRGHVLAGRFRPGTALPETQLAQSLGVSRNTVREALRALASDLLVTVEPNRGAFVRRLTPADVADIYRARRRLELGAVDVLAEGGTGGPGVVAGGSGGPTRSAAEANRAFHVALVAVHASPRIDAFFGRLMTEMSLGFLALPDPEAFHVSYRPRNRAIARLLHDGSFADARAGLAAYLADAEAQVTEAVAADV
jgi:DNA-binding GntR family transcriptional regulator